MQKIVFFLFSMLIYVNLSLAQVAGEDLKLLASYHEKIPYFQELITGGQYEEASKEIEGNPFYYSRQFGDGSLTINGITYPQVPLMYDIYRDQVITFHPLYNQRILINPEKVDRFHLANGEDFKYFGQNKSYLHHGNGLYQILKEGEIQVLVKRYKTTKDKGEFSKYSDVFLEKSDLFLLKENQFYQINKAKQAIVLLDVEKRPAKRYVKSKGFRFKSSPSDYLTALVEFAEQENKEVSR